ncbi:hypothetical protein SAMN05421736_11824 [Evansella caseinilytica]|uniref:Uncharacterized protein n=1 Tax=Evansella caseinilytica TaxID=1503961 RepID=A0A1H3U3B8_9BACI|nr:hypothetical protein [Evansella caseinilytica]SDZ56966.1 hypothetical protein SAMN05421736_11824 [Evansella caseinilytica]
MGNYIADRDELSNMVEQHQRVIKEWDEHAENIKAQQSGFFSMFGDYIIDINVQKETDKYKNDKEAILKFWGEMAQADYDAKRQFQAASEELIRMLPKIEAIIRDIGHNGRVGVDKLNGRISVDKLIGILFADKEMFTELLSKLFSDEVLTKQEKDYLSLYIQHQILKKEGISEVEEIIGFLNNSDMDKLKDRLTNQVLINEESLENEIALIQAYLFMPSGVPNAYNLGDEGEAIEKINMLQTYLSILKNYQIFINEMEIRSGHKLEDYIGIMVPTIELTYSDEENSDIYKLRSTIMSMTMMSAEDKPVEIFEVTRFNGSGANVEITTSQVQDIRNKIDNYPLNYVNATVLNKLYGIVGDLPKGTGFALEVIKDYDEYIKGKSELQYSLTRNEGQALAGALKMEIMISERKDLPNINGENKEILDIIFIPTDATYEILERWEEVSEYYPAIELPGKKLIDSENWAELSNELSYIKTEVLSKSQRPIYEYIYNGVLNRDTLEEMINSIER